MRQFIVYLQGRYYDTVFHEAGTSAEEVRKELIEHDGYPSNIKVKRVKKNNK